MSRELRLVKSLALLAICIISLLSCSSGKHDYPTPPYNYKELNTPNNDISVVQMPIKRFDNNCQSEFDSGIWSDSLSISHKLLADIIKDTSNILSEGLTLIDSKSGFMAVSHPPDLRTSNLLSLPIGGIIGGTDIFQFELGNVSRKFSILGGHINTKSWDSHPFSVRLDDGSILLLWSSDRADNRGGFSSPFLNYVNIEDSTYQLGNSDLYYTFFKDGVWSDIKNFSGLGGDISSPANDESPSLYCLCWSTSLYFASNRGNKYNNDYDIYRAKIKIDPSTQTINLVEAARILDKSDIFINTNSKEFFPYVKKPVTNNGKAKLYLSSNRYIDGSDKYRSRGGFDIYEFEIDDECRPPKISYVLDIVSSDNSLEVPLSAANLRNQFGENISLTQSGSKFIAQLNFGDKYLAEGYSTFDQIECNDTDSVIAYFAKKVITPKTPLIEEYVVPVKVEKWIASEEIVKQDTLVQISKLPINLANQIKPENDSSKILSISIEADSIIVKKMTVSNRKELVGGTRYTVDEYQTRFDTIPQFDTTYLKSYQSPVASGLSMLGHFPKNLPINDTVIYDEVILNPRYYFFPPCRWEFIYNQPEYRRNVPYYQTGFWLVNTEAGLENHLHMLYDKKFADASFIELHQKNKYWGPKRIDRTPANYQYYLNKRWQRLLEYRHYAKTVDSNLAEMAKEITKSIIPNFKLMIDQNAANDERIIIQIYAYSDIRPINKGVFINNGSSIGYISSEWQEDDRIITTEMKFIEDGASLIGPDNETLSDLRAYFGYLNLKQLLMKDSLFMAYVSRGEVLFPDEVYSESQFQNLINSKKIIILTKGMRIDPTTPQQKYYNDRKDDYYQLDEIRRINVIVNRVEFMDGKFIISPCCRE